MSLSNNNKLKTQKDDQFRKENLPGEKDIAIVVATIV
jgi:hypothetical protein